MQNSLVFSLIAGLLIVVLVFSGTIGALGAFGLIFLLAIVGGAWYNIDKEKERKELTAQRTDELKRLDGFSSTKKLIGPWGLIAIDDQSKQIAFKQGPNAIRKYHYADIIGCEVVEDGETTYRKSGALGRAIVGGIIAGGAGAIIGGVTAKGQENKEVKTVDFKLLLRDTSNPSFRIRFFDAWEESARTKKSVKVSDSVYGPILRKAVSDLNSWKETVGVIIDQMDRETGSVPRQNSSLADELAKLNDLKNQGVLTGDEFEQQKAKLLGS